MIIKTLDLRNVTDKILMAVDTSEISTITETIELETRGENLIISVTNKEYFAMVKLHLGYVEDFHAAVNANNFLKLIGQTTTEEVELTCNENFLQIKGNGKYKLPLIFDGTEPLRLTKIEINNPTVEMSIPSSTLQSILKYNSKELSKGIISKPIQKLYYMDEKGCLTFTTGACVNNFTLEKPVKMLLNNKLVKLFKLFNEGNVDFTLGYDALSNDIIQTKVRFEDDTVSLTAILSCDDTMLNSVPVNAIRGRAETVYPYSVTINKDSLIQTINRLSIFNKGAKDSTLNSATFKFGKDSVEIVDSREENSETLNYINEVPELEATPYIAKLNLNDVKLTLGVCDESHLTINFGDGNAFVIARTNILNVIPQVI